MSKEKEKGETLPGNGAGQEEARQNVAQPQPPQAHPAPEGPPQPAPGPGAPGAAGEGAPGAAGQEAPGAGGEEAPGAAGEEAPEAAPPEPSPEELLAAELEGVRRELAAAQERQLRLQAELENFKKRIAKEHADSLRFALTPLVAEVAGIMDNLERAVAHTRAGQGDSLEQLLAGIELVIKQMREALARFGVTRIEAVGKPFDPTLHEAITVVETNDVPDNLVIEEFQPGYLLHDRVVRPARVSVAKPAAEGGGAQPNAEP